MPGGYGPGGKWIHDRAHRIMAEGKTQEQYGDERGKSIAYALATQQAHKTGKSPKDFRTAKGVRVAKRKYDAPKSEYRKTAGRQEQTDYANLALAAIRRGMERAKAFKLLGSGKIDELKKFAPGEVALQAFEKAMPKAAAADPAALAQAAHDEFWRLLEQGKAARAAGVPEEHIKPLIQKMHEQVGLLRQHQAAIPTPTATPTPTPSGGSNFGRNLALVGGGALATGLLLHTMAKRRAQSAAAAQSAPGAVKMAMINGLFDELQKIAQTPGEYASALTQEIQGAGGQMTQRAYELGRQGWEKRQQILGALKPRLAQHREMLTRSALKPQAGGFFSRLFKTGQAPGSLAHRAQLGAPGAWGSLQGGGGGGGGGGTPGGSVSEPAAAAPPPPPPTTAPTGGGGGSDFPSALGAGDMGGGGPPGGAGAMKPPGGLSGSDIPGALGAGDMGGGGAAGATAAPPPPPPPMPPAPSAGSAGAGGGGGTSGPGPATAAGRMQSSQAGQAQAEGAIKGGFQPGAAKPMTASDLGI